MSDSKVSRASDHEYFVDTNIFLRIIVKDDEKKAADCEKVIEAIRKGALRAITSHLVLAEVVWTCLSLYRIAKSDVARLGRGIISIHHLSFHDDFDALRALSYYDEYSVKFIDALIASHARIARGEVEILSYDTDFDKMGIARVEPCDVLKGVS